MEILQVVWEKEETKEEGIFKIYAETIDECIELMEEMETKEDFTVVDYYDWNLYNN